MTGLASSLYQVRDEVREALAQGKPVVALESTVITHGLPYPENLQLAQAMEQEVRLGGCVPATVAVLEGRICVGLDDWQLNQLVKADKVIKVSVRDLAHAVSKGRSGGTTVAGTLAVAEAVGIKVFATGGIGGVHRQAPFDVSTDLGELAKARVIVVCAGAKAILDIPATLEVLETYGVPVIGYLTDEFPAFYSTSSGKPVSMRAESGDEVARFAHAHWDLGLPGAVLVAVPPPAEVALDPDLVERAISKVLEESRQKGIEGQRVTPFLLKRVSELTGGLSMQTNLGLLRNNARVAAEIARSFA